MQPKNTRVMVVDALNLAFRYKHGLSKSAELPDNLDFTQSYIGTIQSLAASYKCSHIIVACDKGGSTYRKSIHPGYKQARRDKHDSASEREKLESTIFFDAFENAMKEVEALDKRSKMCLLRYQGVEADDIAAMIVEERHNFGISGIQLVSSDKDWDLLIEDGVDRFCYVTRKDVSVDTWDKYYSGVPLGQLIFRKCLTGDSGDSVPGVPGIGEVRSKALIQEYGDLDTLLTCMPLEGKYKYIETLNASADLLRLNLALMDIRSTYTKAIPTDVVMDIRAKLSAKLQGTSDDDDI